jgi:hypothetical protein
MSLYISPRMLTQLLSTLDKQSIEAYKRCKSVVLRNLFTGLGQTLHQLQSEGVSPKRIFIEYLQPMGYIPDAYTRTPSNLLLGFINTSLQWEEWPVPSVDCMRVYWSNILPPSVLRDTEVVASLQTIVSLVPTRYAACASCGWDVPENSMYSSGVCCFCQEQSTPCSAARPPLTESLTTVCAD